jgi:phosphoglycerate dehydrogenase-like enzyme
LLEVVVWRVHGRLGVWSAGKDGCWRALGIVRGADSRQPIADSYLHSMNVLVFAAWPVKAWRFPDEKLAVLQARFPHIHFVHAHSQNEALQAAANIDVAFAPHITPDLLAAAPNLTWVHSSAAAVQGLLALPELAARGVRITNSRGVQAVPIAEHVMGGLLVLSRKFDRTLAAQRDREWAQAELCDTNWPFMLHGRSMTIVGLGTIGMEIARRADAFGMRVTGVRKRLDQPRPDFVDRVVGPHQLDDALKGCDVLVLAAPGVAETAGMIGAGELALLNAGAIVVNVARAQIVDGLGSGRLGGAVLDVFEREPLDAESPLWSMPNVVLTPHSSGFRASHWDDLVDLFSENLRRFERGDALLNQVDARVGY